MRLSIKGKISLALLATLIFIGWLIGYILHTQASFERVVEHTIQRHMAAIQGADQVKYLFVRYDDLVFRYLTTHNEALLEEAGPVQDEIQKWIDRLKGLVEGPTEQELLADLERQARGYDKDVKRLIQFYKSKTQAERRGFLDLFREGPSQPRALTPQEKQDLNFISSIGQVRLTRIHTLCEKMGDVARVKMEDAQALIRNKVYIARKTTLATGGLVVAAVIAISVVLAISLLAPLRNLLGGVQQVSSGELNLELPVTNSDEVGRLTQLFNGMTRRLRQEHERLVNETVTDPLTELYNLRFFQSHLRNEIARAGRYQRPFSLLLIDIDHFKRYNDENGHPLGNIVLKQVAGILKESLREEGAVARFGGEEFALILPEAGAQEGKVVAERLRAAVEQAVFPGKDRQGDKITVSLGGASFPADGTIAAQLLERADRALYQAKQQGRNRAVWAT